MRWSALASGKTQIITDSTCALPTDVPASVRAAVRIVRTAVQFEHETWVEGTFTLDQFYARLATTDSLPHTSQPAPDEYLHAYHSAAQAGPVLAIFLSGALSGTYPTGVAMARDLPNGVVEVFDSQFFSSALGYLVAEAAEMALAGASRRTILERLRWRRSQTMLVLTVRTLEFLRKSGRVNLLQAGIATMLDLKPIISVEQGRLEVVGRVRSRQRSLNQLLALAEKHAAQVTEPLWVSAMHGNAADEAARLLDELTRRLPVTRCFISEAPASLALHGGPGVVGVTVTPAGPSPLEASE